MERPFFFSHTLELLLVPDVSELVITTLIFLLY